jgi:hypothetical protein
LNNGSSLNERTDYSERTRAFQILAHPIRKHQLRSPDPTQQHFQVVASGWDGQKRVHTMLVHIVIRDHLIWLEEDLTDAEIAEQLIEQGIPRDHIVLGFQAPYKRGLYGFATGEV